MFSISTAARNSVPEDFDNAKAKCQEAVTALEEKKRTVQGAQCWAGFQLIQG